MNAKVLLLSIFFSKLVVCGGGGKFIHISDIHLDLLSDPSKYGPAQFCRDPKNMPGGFF